MTRHPGIMKPCWLAGEPLAIIIESLLAPAEVSKIWYLIRHKEQAADEDISTSHCPWEYWMYMKKNPQMLVNAYVPAGDQK